MSALALLGSDAAFSIINREKLYRFLVDLKNPDGSFSMERGGEVDVRAAYCVLAVSTLLGLRTDYLERGLVDWLLSCQTYEGGFGAAPFLEAHGGYAYCALASLRLLQAGDRANLRSLRRWTAERQVAAEGGFNGRTNKLVDGCYSFWVGALWPLLDLNSPELTEWGCDPLALQKYVLACCQDEKGGLIDKPGKPRDFYHTCYTLSGLSLAQRAPGSKVLGDPANLLVRAWRVHSLPSHLSSAGGNESPSSNIGTACVTRALAWANNHPIRLLD